MTPSQAARSGARPGPAPAPVAPAPVPPALLGTLERLAAEPGAPFVLGIAGDGGTGKTAGLAALRRSLRAAGVPVTTLRGAAGARWPDPPPPPAGAVLVDDAHGLDDAALGRLLDLVDDDGTRLAVTFRGWPRPPLLGVVSRELELRGALVTLGALDRSQVAMRAAAHLGRTPPAALVDHVLRASAGIPRWVDLLLAGTPVTGPSPAPAGWSVAALPWDLLLRLDADLGPADGVVRSVVLALAVGAASDAGSLAAVLGLDPGRAHAALAEARGAGLLRADGGPVPVARQAVLAAAPSDRVRALVAASVRADLDRGAPAEAVAARVSEVPVLSPDLAALLHRAAAAVRDTEPARAAELLAAACDADPAGADDVLRVERAECELLAGDVDTALRLAEPLLGADERPADRRGPRAAAPTAGRRAGMVVTAALAHRGLLEQAARLHEGPRHPAQPGAAPPPACALITALACGLVGPSGDAAPQESPSRDDVPGVGAARDLADQLVLAGLRASLLGDGGGCLPLLGRASALLRGTPRAPAPDTPEAIAAVAAISGGDVGHAQRVLHGALAARAGGPVASPRHRLLLAWCAMLGGAFDVARRLIVQATDGDHPPAGRDELLRRALELGLARRTHDPAALVRAWPAAHDALTAHGVDLFMLLPLGEITVVAARLDETHRVAATLAEAHALLARSGEPVLWAMPLHWAGVHAAIAAERPDAVAPHAAALVRGARVSRHALTLADAGRAWMRVLAGRVDAPSVERAARRLHAAGLGWDASRLAAHAAARSDDHRASGQLLQVARDLQRAAPAEERGPASHLTGAGTGSAGTRRAGDRTGSGAAGADGAPVHALAPPRAGDGAGTVALSAREVEVAHLVLAGHTYREISERLYISTKTVEHHVARMRQRLGLESRAALLAHLRAHLDPRRPG